MAPEYTAGPGGPIGSTRRGLPFRPLRAALGLLLGFLGAFGAIQAIDLARQAAADAEPEILGEVDLFAHCRQRDGDQVYATLLSDDADGWRCAGRRNGLWSVNLIDMDRACEDVHGTGAFAIRPDEDSPYGWTCARVP